MILLFFKILTNARMELTDVMKTQPVPINWAPTLVIAKVGLKETGNSVLVSAKLLVIINFFKYNALYARTYRFTVLDFLLKRGHVLTFISYCFSKGCLTVLRFDLKQSK